VRKIEAQCIAVAEIVRCADPVAPCLGAERRIQIVRRRVSKPRRQRQFRLDLPARLRGIGRVDRDRRNRESGFAGPAIGREVQRERRKTPAQIGIEQNGVDIGEIDIMDGGA